MRGRGRAHPRRLPPGCRRKVGTKAQRVPNVRKRVATPTGFEPAISALTGQYVKPLHHGAASVSSSKPYIEYSGMRGGWSRLYIRRFRSIYRGVGIPHGYASDTNRSIRALAGMKSGWSARYRWTLHPRLDTRIEGEGAAQSIDCAMRPPRRWMDVEGRWRRWTVRRPGQRPGSVRRHVHLREGERRRARPGRSGRAG